MEYVQRFTIKANRQEEYRNWLAENQQRLRDDSPDDWTYLGTFFVVHATADYLCESRWRIDTYSALEPRIAEHPKWRKVIEEHSGFVADLPPMRTVLLKDAADVTIIGEEVES